MKHCKNKKSLFTIQLLCGYDDNEG